MTDDDSLHRFMVARKRLHGRKRLFCSPDIRMGGTTMKFEFMWLLDYALKFDYEFWCSQSRDRIHFRRGGENVMCFHYNEDDGYYWQVST